MSLFQSVERSLNSATLLPADEGVRELALTYAKSIDEGGDLDKLGARLLAALDALGLTPRARAAILKGANDERPDGHVSPLDELRKRREDRTGRARFA